MKKIFFWKMELYQGITGIHCFEARRLHKTGETRLSNEEVLYSGRRVFPHVFLILSFKDPRSCIRFLNMYSTFFSNYISLSCNGCKCGRIFIQKKVVFAQLAMRRTAVMGPNNSSLQQANESNTMKVNPIRNNHTRFLQDMLEYYCPICSQTTLLLYSLYVFQEIVFTFFIFPFNLHVNNVKGSI